MRRLAIVALSLVIACSDSDVPTPSSAPTGPLDAGDEAFVKRVIPLMWGRRTLSARETAVLTQMAQQGGREALVRAMANSEEYRAHWEQVLKDALAVHRLQFRANAGCYGRSAAPEIQVQLAEHVMDNGPFGAPYDTPWTMRDLLHSALVLDDLSALYVANLPAQLTRALDDMHLLASVSQRRSRAQSFMTHYLDRRMSCLECHNSASSVTKETTFQIDCLFEEAVFGSSLGVDIMQLTSFFRRKGVLAGYRYTNDDDEDLTGELAGAVRPWGWDAECGEYLERDKIRADDYEEFEGHFIQNTGALGSIWDLVDHLAAGFESLRASDLSAVCDDGPKTFAYMVSMATVQTVWETAYASRLQAPHRFPRHPAQRDKLKAMTDTFVRAGYSLVDLLVAVTTDPLFNGALPSQGGDPQPYPALYDPFFQDDVPVMEHRRNEFGHTIFRAPARVLLRSAYGAMEWAALPEYLMYYLEPAARLQREIGVFLANGDSGFRGTSFQSALSWEASIGVCADPDTDPQCPLRPILDAPADEGTAATTCELCNNKDAACDWDARCCDLAWETWCDDTCETGDPTLIDLSVWPTWEAPGSGDFIDRIMDAGQGGTLEAAVRALKDRLLGDPSLAAAEPVVLEALAEKALSEPLADSDEAGLRRICGLLTATPQFQLLGNPGPDLLAATPDGLVVPGTSFKDYCERHAPLFSGTVTCGVDTLNVQ